MTKRVYRNWDLKKIPWTNYFIITSPFVWSCDEYIIRVDKWFITDFWSIPSIFFNFNRTKYISYILHDYLYSLKCKVYKISKKEENLKMKKKKGKQTLSFSDKFSLVETDIDKIWADNILYKMLKYEWMSDLWIKIVKIWLTIWGWFNFRKRDIQITKIKRNLWI